MPSDYKNQLTVCGKNSLMISFPNISPGEAIEIPGVAGALLFHEAQAGGQKASMLRMS